MISFILRFITIFTFYPMLVLWFIPREAYRAFKKAKKDYYHPIETKDESGNVVVTFPDRSFNERIQQAKTLLKYEIRVALSGRRRKPISLEERQALDRQFISEMKNDPMQEEIFQQLGVSDNGEESRG